VLSVLVSIGRRQKREIVLAVANLLAFGAGVVALLGFYKYTTGNPFAQIDAQKYFVFNLSITNMFSPSHFLNFVTSSSHQLFDYNNSIMDKIFIGFIFLGLAPVAFGKDWKVIFIYFVLVLPTAMMGEGSSFIRHSLLIWPFIVLSVVRRNWLGRVSLCALAGLLFTLELYLASRFAANMWVG
jgi:hypothetical protein